MCVKNKNKNMYIYIYIKFGATYGEGAADDAGNGGNERHGVDETG